MHPPSQNVKRRRWLALCVAGALAVTCAGAEVGDTVYVDRISLSVRSGKFAFDKVLATALHGEAMKVADVQGKWLKVVYTPRSPDPSKPPPPSVTGYVLEDALTAVVPVVAATNPTGNAANLGAVGASKGLLNASAYAASQGLTSEPFWAMVTDARRSMNGADVTFDDFMKEGKLGPYKPGTPPPPAVPLQPLPATTPTAEPLPAPVPAPAAPAPVAAPAPAAPVPVPPPTPAPTPTPAPAPKAASTSAPSSVAVPTPAPTTTPARTVVPPRRPAPPPATRPTTEPQ